MEIKIEMCLPVAWRRDDDTGIFVSWCPPLNIYSQGETAQEAVSAAQSAASMFLKHCLRKNILETILKERGFVRIADHGTLPTISIAISKPEYQCLSTMNIPVCMSQVDTDSSRTMVA